MMRARFLAAFTRNQAVASRLRSTLASVCSGPDFKTVPARAANLLLISSTSAFIPIGTDGLILGSLFQRGGATQRRCFEPAEQEAIVRSRGEWLIGACWGGYVAILPDAAGQAIQVIRAPLGDLPCYVLRHDEAILCASDVALLRASGLFKPTIDDRALSRHLAAEDLRGPFTCLEGLRELPGGSRLTINEGSTSHQALWSPWLFASKPNQYSDIKEAAWHVRAAALHCVAARATECGPVLLKLSGGLDSSIVAACLATEEKPFACLNLATRDPAGDERRYARTVAKAFGVPISEALREYAGVAIERSAAARLPRPTVRSFVQESVRHATDVAGRVGAQAVFDGGGGDNLFCFLPSARPVTDWLMSWPADGRLWPTIHSIADMTQSSLFTVMRRALAIWRRTSPAFAWPLDFRFLSADAKAAARGAGFHPWLEPPEGALPGKAAHVALITSAQSVAEGADVEDPLPTYSPLISQPLVETCLQVPAWYWYDQGRDREVARRAFAAMLPEFVIQRRSKGAPDSFVAELFQINRSLIRSLLLEGYLREHGIIDTSSLAPRLDEPGPIRGNEFIRIMQLADAEAWARCWS